MNATERLRQLLDERGVEYVLDEEYGKKYPPEQSVTWSCDIAGEDMTVTARDYCIGINDDGNSEYCLDLEFHEVFTPEQAVEATLGRGTCRMCKRKGYDREHLHHYECSECGEEVLRSSVMGESEPPRFCPECGRRVEP